MKRSIYNLTNSPILIKTEDNVAIIHPEPESVKMVTDLGETYEWDVEEHGCIDIADGVKIRHIFGLPEEEEGIYYIVPTFLGNMLKGKRGDLLIPATATKDGCVRDSNGNVKYITKLIWI